MIDHQAQIEEDLMIEVGLGATYHCGSDSYPYYVSEVLPKGVIGLYRPNSHFEKDWTDGHGVVDKFDQSHETETYIRRSYGHWWICDKNGKRIGRWHNISFGSACAYTDPSF